MWARKGRITQSLNTGPLLHPFALPFGVPLMCSGHSFHLYHSPLTFFVCHMREGWGAAPSPLAAHMAVTHCLS